MFVSKSVKLYAALSSCVLLFPLVAPSNCRGQDGILEQEPNFHAIVLNAMAARGVIESGAYDYKMRHYRDGELSWSAKGQHLFDIPLHRSMHTFEKVFPKGSKTVEQWGTLADGVATATKDGGTRLIGGCILSRELSVVKPLQEAETYRKVGLAPVPLNFAKPFEFQQFGFGYIADTLAVRQYDQILNSFLTADLEKIVTLSQDDVPKEMVVPDGTIRYFDYGGNLLAIDIKSGFWPLRSRATMGKYEKTPKGGYRKIGEKVVSKCSIKTVELDGHFLPESVEYSGNGQRLVISIDWAAVNGMPKETEFSLETFAERLAELAGKPQDE